MFISPRSVKIKLNDTPDSPTQASGYAVRVADAATGATVVPGGGFSLDQMPLGDDGYRHLQLNQASGFDLSGLVGQSVKVGVSAYAPPPDAPSAEVFSDSFTVAQVAEPPDPPVEVVLEA